MDSSIDVKGNKIAWKKIGALVLAISLLTCVLPALALGGQNTNTIGSNGSTDSLKSVAENSLNGTDSNKTIKPLKAKKALKSKKKNNENKVTKTSKSKKEVTKTSKSKKSGSVISVRAKCSCSLYKDYNSHGAVWLNYCPHCHSHSLIFEHPGDCPEGMIRCTHCDADYCAVHGKEHVYSGSAYLTPA